MKIDILNRSGFTYLTLLFIIVAMGLSLAVAGKVVSTYSKREKEAELIFRGGEIRKAIGAYYMESVGAKAYPKDLQYLLKDQRYPVVKRYLRKLYDDPFTGKPDWELIKAPDGGIMGVKSRSTEEPLKKGNFPSELTGFDDRAKYSEWEFIYVPAKTGQSANTLGKAPTQPVNP